MKGATEVPECGWIFERFATIGKPGSGISRNQWQQELASLSGQFPTPSDQAPRTSKTIAEVKSGFSVDGKPAVMLDCRLPNANFRYRTYYVAIKEQPRVSHRISIFQYEDEEEDLIKAFLQSIEIISHDSAR